MSNYNREEKILKPQKQHNGYLIVNLLKGKAYKKELIHRLVAKAFIENPKEEKYINHMDSNIENNEANNLEWCTQSHNIQYAYDNGRKVPPHMKKVAQIDITTGEKIKIFNSIAEAYRFTGINNISACCRKIRNKAGEYEWEFV